MDREDIAESYPGIVFLPLKKYLKEFSIVGYYTNTISSNPWTDVNAMWAYQQAQYALSPVLLDFNNLNHQFIVFNVTSAKVLLEKIQEIQAIPILDLKNGIALVKRKNQ
ncbi:MAG: hypothetical protein HY209_06145 [Candidatus Omnitrophica bacterium]|nr:hypothetical protein [Candidatus Omnitrophota bacterium]